MTVFQIIVNNATQIVFLVKILLIIAFLALEQAEVFFRESKNLVVNVQQDTFLN